MAKIVYNACHGGFGLSAAAVARYAEIKGIKLFPESDPRSGRIVTYWTAPKEERHEILLDQQWHEATQDQRSASDAAWNRLSISPRDIKRSDPALIQVVEELGEAANGFYASLAIAEVQDGLRYRIDEYDGSESVMTVDDYEWSIAGADR